MYAYWSSFRQKAVDVYLPLQYDITEVHTYMLQFEQVPSPIPTGW
jgi:hypothetical protein